MKNQAEKDREAKAASEQEARDRDARAAAARANAKADNKADNRVTGTATDAEYARAHKSQEQATYGTTVDERIAKQAWDKQEAQRQKEVDEKAREPKPIETIPYPTKLTPLQQIHKELVAAEHGAEKSNPREAGDHIRMAKGLVERLIDLKAHVDADLTKESYDAEGRVTYKDGTYKDGEKLFNKDGERIYKDESGGYVDSSGRHHNPA